MQSLKEARDYSSFGEFGEYCGLVGEYCGLVGLYFAFPGDPGEKLPFCCGLVGLYTGDVGL